MASTLIADTNDKWCDIEDKLQNASPNIKEYFNIALQHGWKYFMFHKPRMPMTKGKLCHGCKQNKQHILYLSCDADRCSFPRFMPHMISICLKCVNGKNAPPDAPSCCFEKIIMIKSANKQ